MNSLTSLFAPRSIAVVGASQDTNKIRGRLLKLLVGGGYAGVEVAAVIAERLAGRARIKLLTAGEWGHVMVRGDVFCEQFLSRWSGRKLKCCWIIHVLYYYISLLLA